MKYFSNLRQNLGPGVDGWAISLKGMMSIVVLMGLAICFIYWWVNKSVPLPTRSKKKKVILSTILSFTTQSGDTLQELLCKPFFSFFFPLLTSGKHGTSRYIECQNTSIEKSIATFDKADFSLEGWLVHWSKVWK